MDKKDVEELRFVDVGGATYTGYYDKESNRMTEAVKDKTLRGYVMMDNKGELEDVEFGQGQSITVRKLTPEQKIQLNTYIDTMAYVKTYVSSKLENDEFDRVSG